MHYSKHFTLWIFILVISAILSGCTKDKSTEPTGTAPDIPPASTFLINFADFSSGNQAGSTGNSLAKPLSKNNWFYSAANVAIWQSLLNITLAVPAHSFAAAFLKDPDPEQQADGSWLWAYDFNVLSGSYHADLYGKTVSDSVEWNMFISREGVYENFNWYSGVSDLLSTAGSWTLNHMPQDPTAMLFIEWHRTIGELTYDIRYTNIVPGSDDNGSYIFNAFTPDSTFDAHFSIYKIQSDNTTFIDWNRLSRAGRVKDNAHFGDDDWHCWDENLNDVTCSN